MAKKTPKARKVVTAGEGERRAQRGFQHRYGISATPIYAALLQNKLNWIGLADRSAGILDDLLLGLEGNPISARPFSSLFTNSTRNDLLLESIFRHSAMFRQLSRFSRSLISSIKLRHSGRVITSAVDTPIV